jgi:hypothetical protein
MEYSIGDVSKISRLAVRLYINTIRKACSATRIDKFTSHRNSMKNAFHKLKLSTVPQLGIPLRLSKMC